MEQNVFAGQAYTPIRFAQPTTKHRHCGHAAHHRRYYFVHILLENTLSRRCVVDGMVKLQGQWKKTTRLGCSNLLLFISEKDSHFSFELSFALVAVKCHFQRWIGSIICIQCFHAYATLGSSTERKKKKSFVVIFFIFHKWENIHRNNVRRRKKEIAAEKKWVSECVCSLFGEWHLDDI